jgi:hypothetical protein
MPAFGGDAKKKSPLTLPSPQGERVMSGGKADANRVRG